MSAPSNTPGVYDFSTLCTPHYQALVLYANRLLPGRPQEARDLVQEAYLRAVRTWDRWSPSTGEDPIRAARGWLHRIVQNVFLDQSRANTGHRKLLGEHHHIVVSRTYGVDTDHQVQNVSDGIGDEVRQALDQLDSDQRDVVVRADFGGEQYLAIASSLGIPLGTVMSRLHRGRKRLAESLKIYARREYGISPKEIVVKKGVRRRLAAGTHSDCTPTESEPESESLDEPADVVDYNVDAIWA